MTEPARPVLCSFESRRAEEMAALIARHGGQSVSAPSMREIPIDDNPAAIQFVNDVIAHRFSAVILLTGVGTEALFDVARSQGRYQSLLDAFRRTTLIVRGPKPATVLAKVGLKYSLRAPEPNTWRELLTAIDQSDISIRGKSVAVQEYGLPSTKLYAELTARGADVKPVPVYRWALPEDTCPLESALQRVAAREIDAVLFTSANQVSSVLSVAEQKGAIDGFRAAVEERTLVGSIGPTCSEALVDNGLPVHFEASPPKMGPLVRGIIEAWQSRRDLS
jgi:uroporphyrinogen-III synthase